MSRASEGAGKRADRVRREVSNRGLAYGRRKESTTPEVLAQEQLEYRSRFPQPTKKSATIAARAAGAPRKRAGRSSRYPRSSDYTVRKQPELPKRSRPPDKGYSELILEMWEQRWGSQNPEHQRSFLERRELASIRKFRHDQIREAVDRHKRLSDIDEELWRLFGEP